MPWLDDEVPYRWKTVRIFLSSTFRDFHAERDYLVKHVFPGLRQWCARFKLHLVDIDLRWGVTAAETESGKVIDICLEQIDGSRPFFVCMLGNRYGWVPGPEGIPDATRERYDRLRGKERFSITHLEIYYAILSSLTTETSREEASQALFFFREETSLPEPESIAVWSADEREEYRRTFFESDPSNAERLAELESHIIRHYRERTDTAPVPAGSGRRIYTYKPRFNSTLTNPEDGRLKGRFTVSSLRPFGRLVSRSIHRAIRSQFADRIRYFTREEARKDRSRERDLHLDFIEIRTRLFVGREKIRRKLQSYVNGDSNRLLALSGDPGSGKSAVLAQFYQDWTHTMNARDRDGDHLLIPHFVGASAASSSLNHMLRRVCEEIYHHFLEQDHKSRLGSVAGDGDEAEKKRADIRREYETPMETNRLVGTFHSFLEMATGNIVLLLDGLDYCLQRAVRTAGAARQCGRLSRQHRRPEHGFGPGAPIARGFWFAEGCAGR